jgi:serine/threonine protein kinase
METVARTGSTVVVGAACRLTTADAADASGFVIDECAEAGPPDASEDALSEDLAARLDREPVGPGVRGEESVFEAPGFDPGEFSRFEAQGLEAGGTIDGQPEESGWRFERQGADTVLPPARPIPPSFPGIGETVGEFRLLACLGRGVRGAVFLADQPSLAHRPVVLKITARDGREHLSLAQLRHTHIVPLYHVQDLADRDLRLLCMPYLGGASLGQILNDLGGMPIARRTARDLLARLDRIQAESPIAVSGEGAARLFLSRASYSQMVCWIGASLADALQFAHQRGLVHLDLKPSNILLAADGTPMLLDFHLAQPPIRPDQAAHRWMGGTPHYLSPEQRVVMTELREGRTITVAVDGRSDIYALGLVLYQMLGGMISIGPYPMPRIKFRRPPHVPLGLADIVAKCLAPDPRDRYADAARLSEDLRRQLADLPLRGVRNRSLTERWRKWSRRHPRALTRVMTTASTAAALILAAWLVVNGDARQRLRGAESFLAEGRKHMDRRDYPAAVRALDHGLELIGRSWSLALHPDRGRSDQLRRDLERQVGRVQRARLADELHELADRLRFLYGTDVAGLEALRALEARLRPTWESRGRILAQLAGALEPGIEERLRTDFLDLGILWADLRVRLARGDVAEARREALRTLDEAEHLFGASPVLARERRCHAEALGLADLAREAARRQAELAPRTAWEHYALGRSLLAAGALDAAAAELDRATDLQPQDLWAQFSRGICAYRRRRFETALSAFDVCVALSPATAECYFNRARAHEALGHVDLARRDDEHAARLCPTLVDAPLNHDILYDRARP